MCAKAGRERLFKEDNGGREMSVSEMCPGEDLREEVELAKKEQGKKELVGGDRIGGWAVSANKEGQEGPYTEKNRSNQELSNPENVGKTKKNEKKKPGGTKRFPINGGENLSQRKKAWRLNNRVGEIKKTQAITRQRAGVKHGEENT